MPHEIDISTGQAAVFTAGAPPWHGLGRNIQEAVISAQAIEVVEDARRPFFGMPERLRDRMRSETMPECFDCGAALRRHAESFEPHRWEVAQPNSGDNA
jgi:hypothetical protein